jgi:hypothetical protein
MCTMEIPKKISASYVNKIIISPKLQLSTF